MLFHDFEPVRGRKFLDFGDIGTSGAEALCEVLRAQMATLLLFELLNKLGEPGAVAASQHHADLQPLGRIGFTDSLCPVQWLALAALEWMSTAVSTAMTSTAV